jgi:HSP20 family protein
MAFTISLKRKGPEDEDLLLFPEAEGLAPMRAREERQDDGWLHGHDEGRLAVDVYETEKEIVIMSAIAGVKPEDLEVFLHNDMLTVRGRRSGCEIPGGKPLVRECHWGSFSRSVILPTEIDADGIAATLKDGVLTVRLPKLERSKRISVKEVE